MTVAVPSVQPFPDAELVVIKFLEAREFNVAASAPSKPTRPNLVVTRIGGSPAVKWAADNARIQVDVWASTKAQAREVAAAALAACYEMPGQAGADQHAYVTDVDVNLGLVWMPDDAVQPATPRYLFEVAVVLRPIN